VNQRWREYAGLSPEESQGWGWQIAIHPEDLPSLMRKWRELLSPENQVKSNFACAARMGSFVGSSLASNSGDVFQKENTLFEVLFLRGECAAGQQQ
jgi:hypothetical protein